MKTIKLSAETKLTVSRSQKFKSVQVELQKKKDDGTTKKAFLTTKACKKLLALKDEIKSVATVLRRREVPLVRPADVDNGEQDESETSATSSVGERAVELAVDDKKAVTVRKWTDDGRLTVTLQTLKDGQKQPAFAFHLSEEEWTAMSERGRGEILEEIQTLSKAVYTEPDDRIKMYRWMTVKLDGSGVGAVGRQWEYLENRAQEEAQEVVQPGEKIMLEYKMVSPPTREQLYTAVQIYLLRTAVTDLIRANCGGCQTDHGSQTHHMGPGGCLDSEATSIWYQEAVSKLSPMTIAELFHSAASSLNLPTSGSTAVAGACTLTSDQIMKVVTGEEEWSHPELEELCAKIVHRDTKAVQYVNGLAA